ncbi:MAG: DNA alkylation response protein, partial [Actinomycetota bacterium]|nr:DNA alkylation response protein [Actinomycetota bacterium]
LLTAEEPQFHARRMVEGLALALQGSLLVRHAPAAVADAFSASRLAGDCGRVYGTLGAKLDARAIVDRALPA